MHLAVFGLFAAALIVCIIFGLSIIYALLAGLLIFSLCAFKMGHGVKAILIMMFGGVKTARNVILNLLMIGMLTALWRAAGTIPTIICCASSLVHPQTVVLMSFLLNCGVSLLTGTAFGTSATMGVISMTMGLAMGAEPVLLGGAIVSGAYFGDRASPMSTSALLISELTETNVFTNISAMLRRSLIPFIACCLIYTLAGVFLHTGGDAPEFESMFSREVCLHRLCLIPALLVVIMSLFKIRVQITLTVSIITAAILCAALQHESAYSILSYVLGGFHAQDAQVAALLDGGGISSMLNCIAIIIISSTYSGIFSGTGMLDGIRQHIDSLADRTGTFTAVLAASAMTSVISCSQTLAVMLTHQLCRDTGGDRQQLALCMEDTVIVIAALVPWSLAGALPLGSIGAPNVSLLAACFLYLLPLWSMLRAGAAAKRSRNIKIHAES